MAAIEVTSFRGMEQIVQARPTRTEWANKYVNSLTGQVFYGEGKSKAACLTVHRNFGVPPGPGWTWEGVFELEIVTTVTETKRTR